MPREMITALVSDSSPMGCQLLREALTRADETLQIVATCTNLKGVLSQVEEKRPRVALINTSLADGALSGLKGLREIHSRFPNTCCILLAEAPQKEVIIEAFSSGAKGVCFRTDPVDILPKVIRTVCAGQVWVNSQHLHYILEALSAAAPLHFVNKLAQELLPPRQQQVVALVARGMTNREIAQRLFLSEHTVKNYLFRIFEKLGISTRAELIMYVLADETTNKLRPKEQPDRLKPEPSITHTAV